MRRNAKRKHERERADRSLLLRGWFAWHRDECDGVLAGPHGAMFERLLYILKNLTPQSAPLLLGYIRGVDLSTVDYPTRLVMLHEINRAISALRERNGLPPFDDGLPGEREHVFASSSNTCFPRKRRHPGRSPVWISETSRMRILKMANEVTSHEPDADDGFSASSRSRRVGRGSYIKWNDKQGWVDRDGVAVPSPLLVVGVNEILRRWKDNVAEDITDKPLPSADALNASIPVGEWELGADGKLRPPWAHTVVVYLVNLATGETYTYAASTVGAHIAHDALKEAVITMRALRRDKCMPLVNLTERPMKKRYGMGLRPDFEIAGWKTPGGDANAIPVQPAAPQLIGPAAIETSPTSTTAPANAENSPAQSQAKPEPKPEVRRAKPKPAVNVTSETLKVMGDVKPVSTNEILDDEIPSW
jgi:hypothetical protein